MCNCLCGGIVLCWMMMVMKGRCRLIACSSRKGSRLNVPILRTNLYQQYYMPSQHTYCGRVWNLIQTCDVQSSDQKVYISTPPSSEVENFQMKIYYPAGDRTPDLLNQRQTCFHLSQRGELSCVMLYIIKQFLVSQVHDMFRPFVRPSSDVVF